MLTANNTYTGGTTINAGTLQHGQTYGFPIAGHLKLTDRVALDYEIPLQYVDLPESSFFEAGAILNFPIKLLIGSETQPWSWNATPTAAIASTGSKEIIGAGALSNVVSFRCRLTSVITASAFISNKEIIIIPDISSSVPGGNFNP